jgi:IclR family transcriptional regulator, pca regulon regulatory protein
MTDDATPRLREGDLVQSLARGLEVIRAFDDAGPDLSVSEVAERAGITRAAARRFLLTLTSLGYVRTDGRRFALRPTILELGNSYLSSMGLAEVARPHMEKLVADIGDSSALCVLEGHDIYYVALARVPSRRSMPINVGVGTRLPAYPTSMGRVLLAAQGDDWLEDYLAQAELRPVTARTVANPDQLRAELERVRHDGYCVVDQELDISLCSLAVPIRSGDGTVFAALNVSAHASEHAADEMREEFLPPLLATAGLIERDLAAIARRHRHRAFQR